MERRKFLRNVFLSSTIGVIAPSIALNSVARSGYYNSMVFANDFIANQRLYNRLIILNDMIASGLYTPGTAIEMMKII